jgi:hypothetical protein
LKKHSFFEKNISEKNFKIFLENFWGEHKNSGSIHFLTTKFFSITLARRCVEQSFGILASRFPVLSYAVQMDVEAFITFMRSLMILHNFLRDENSADGMKNGIRLSNVFLLDFSDQDGNPCQFGERIPDNPPEDDEEANELRLELIRYLTVVAPIPEQVGRHGF